MQYILDTRLLIAETKAGRAREENLNFNPYLDTNLISGEAAITGNKAGAETLAEQARGMRANRRYLE